MKFSFIGAGNMAGAIINGICEKGFAEFSQICVSDRDAEKLKAFAQKGAQTNSSNTLCADFGDVIVLAVKPNVLPAVAAEIRDKIGDRLVLSIAAGINTAALQSMLGSDKRIIRLVPNTPALVGEGMTVVCKTGNASPSDLEFVCKMFDSVGKTLILGENMMDAVTGVSGSGPAYIYMIIEAMADGGVLCGLPRGVAYTLAAQTVLGSAKMVLDTQKHPGELKDMVCSPGGTTIEAVKVLEQKSVRSAMLDAVVACSEKSKKMAK